MLSIIDKNEPSQKIDPSQFTPQGGNAELLKRSRGDEVREGRMLAIKGYALLVAGIFLPVFDRLFLRNIGVNVPQSLDSVARYALLSIGAATVYQSRRRRAPTFEELRGIDSRRSVLYVRSFDDDARDFDVLYRYNTLLAIILCPPIVFRSKKRYEQVIADILEPVGPLVAIGRPGESLPELGAARTYTTDAEWQDWVITQHRECSMVLMQAGRSAGLRWEVERVFRKDTFKPTLVCFPPDKQNGPPPEDLFQSFRTMLANQNLTMPNTLGKSYAVWFDTYDRGVLVNPGRKWFLGQARLAPGFKGLWPLLAVQFPGVEFKAHALKVRKCLIVTAAWLYSLAVVIYICMVLYYDVVAGVDI